MNKENIPKVVLRIALSIVFLYFGSQQVLHTSDWAGFVPEIATRFFLSANNIVMINGTVELILGIFLLIGIYTRVSAFILSIHLLVIALPMGLNPTAVRDFGLALATFVIFLNGTDNWCIDRKFDKKKN